jgi:hypothetical protein
VFDLSGKAVPVVDLWRDRKAVVAFARHFGSVPSHPSVVVSGDWFISLS